MPMEEYNCRRVSLLIDHTSRILSQEKLYRFGENPTGNCWSTVGILAIRNAMVSAQLGSHASGRKTANTDNTVSAWCAQMLRTG